MSNVEMRRFTVMELVVVLVIGLTLASVLVPAMVGAAGRRDQVACIQRLAELGRAGATFAGLHDGYLPMAANAETGSWHEQLRVAIGDELPLRCDRSKGIVDGAPDVNYGWNSYLGDVTLSPKSQPVQLSRMQRPSGILLAGDGAYTGEAIADGTPLIWGRKTWRRERDQSLLGEVTHGQEQNYVFADGHADAVPMTDPLLVEDPAARPARNYWVELVRPAPGPFFRGE